jgi:hypothetical protein
MSTRSFLCLILSSSNSSLLRVVSSLSGLLNKSAWSSASTLFSLSKRALSASTKASRVFSYLLNVHTVQKAGSSLLQGLGGWESALVAGADDGMGS